MEHENRDTLMRTADTRGRKLALAIALVATFACSSNPVNAQAVQPPLLREFCHPADSEPGQQCAIPRGIAVDVASGDAYVVDNTNNRTAKFTAWGGFVRAWGWDVVASGPGDTAPTNQFEICVPDDGDVCQAGLPGAGTGQFNAPEGVAVDSGGEVYVIDRPNHRVQKFSPEGEFLLTFGGEVNKTKVEEPGSTEAQRNLCPVDPGDICQAGSEGAGAGQFGFWWLGSYIAADSNDTPGDASDDVIYVGDQGRVQEFDSGGNFLGDLPDPDGVIVAEGTVTSLALDPANGDLYLGFFRNVSGPESKPNVHKLSAAGQEVCTIEAHNPTAIAVGPDGEVYLVEGISPTDPREIARFDSECGGRELLFGPETDITGLEGKNQFSGLFNPSAVATSTACGIDGVDLFIPNPDVDNSFVKLFGPAPDPEICPPPLVPPTIIEQFASSVGPEGAVVRARINPRFWPDTTFFVQYATAQCIEGGGWETACAKEQPAAPGVDLTDAVINAPITSKGTFLGATEALIPDTDYRYRFVAQSSGGGPVIGEEEGLHTFPLPGKGKACPNQAFRPGAAANLPDCRAYELVSPIDKHNGDVASPRLEILDQAATDGNVLTFAAFNAFAEPQGAPLYNQFMAERDPSSGWATRSINAPRSSVGLVLQEPLVTRFKVFSEDLCSGWLLQDTDVALVPQAPAEVPNLYRSAGLHQGCDPGGYELLSTVFPPGYDPKVEKTESFFYPQMQGFSADGETSVFRAPAALSENACDTPNEGKGIFQVYLSIEGTPGVSPTLVSVLPGGQAACTQSSVGTSQGFSAVFTIREDSLHNAVSEDAARIYWTATDDGEPAGRTQAGAEPGQIHLRLNPSEPQSAFENGSATGIGNLTAGSNKVNALVAAEGIGTLTAGSTEVSAVASAIGRFVVGQPLNPVGGKIPLGVTIVAVDEENHTLTLSAPASGSGSSVSLESKGPAPFAVGQAISGAGIAPGTTIAAIAAGSLTLSANATKTQSKAALSATSACTEPTKACTLAVSAPAEALSGTSASRFLSAAADGSTAIFSSGEDLYEFDLAKALAGEAPTTQIAQQVEGILGTSEDASRTYLVSREDLDEGASAGEPNLYLYEQGVGLRFVATLSGPNDASNGELGEPTSSIAGFATKRQSRVSPDGLHAAFTSADPALAEEVANYDNLDAASGRPNREIYLYDAIEESLICASCNPSGARPAGRAVEKFTPNPDTHVWAAARLPGWVTSLHPGSLLSADGSTLFFESFEPLVPRDSNGRADVYEWEAVQGSATEAKAQCLEEIGGELFLPASGGCLSLISSGQGSGEAELIDATPDGRDVFFFTNANLVPQDTDFQDIYDARAGGGFPPPSPPAPECEGDACQAAPTPPGDPTPASSVPQSSGNLPNPKKKPCAKGKHRVVRKGKARCVPKKPKGAKRKAARR